MSSRDGRWRAADVLLGCLVPLALARVDPLVERLASLGLLRGPAAWALLAAAVAALGFFALDRRRERAATPGAGADTGGAAGGSRLPAGILFAALSAGYLAIGLHYAAGVQVSGDEPHYLVMAQSLWRDHDLDLRDEYEGEEWNEFAAGPLRPHWGAPRADGRPYPAHSPGLPLLLALPYATFGRGGAIALMALVAAGVVVACRRLAAGIASPGPGAAAERAAWLSVAGPPLLFYSFHLYTEAASALAVAGTLLLLLGRPGPAAAASAALLASVLPWLHLKMIPAAAALGLVALARLRGRPLAAFATTAGLAAAGFGLYYYSVFGSASPLALYGGIPGDARVLTWRSAAGLLLDRSFGLLPIAPVFLLAFAGLPSLLRRPGAWPHAAVAAAIVLPLLSWRMWWGGQCPPARFLVPLLPFFAVALACRMAEPRVGLARWWRGLVAVGFALAAFAVAEPSTRMLLNRRDRPTRLWAALSGQTAIGDYLPSLTHASERDARVAAVWFGAALLLLALDWLAQRRPRVDRLFRSFAVAVSLALSIGAVIDVAVGRPARPATPAAVEEAADLP